MCISIYSVFKKFVIYMCVCAFSVGSMATCAFRLAFWSEANISAPGACVAQRLTAELPRGFPWKPGKFMAIGPVCSRFLSRAFSLPRLAAQKWCSIHAALSLSLSLSPKEVIYIYISIYIHTEKEGTKASCRQRIVSFSGGRLSIYLAGVYRHIGCGLSICSRTLGESCR